MDALPVREGIVKMMKASAALKAFVPEASMYGERVPDDRTYPFTRMGNPEGIPLRTSCWNGTRETLSIHGFFKGLANDEAARFGAAVRTELDGKAVADHPEKPSLSWLSGVVLPDPEEPDTWHSVSDFEIA